MGKDEKGKRVLAFQNAGRDEGVRQPRQRIMKPGPDALGGPKRDKRGRLDGRLFEAADKGDAAAAMDRIREGADVNAKDENGWTALILASWNGHTDVVELLVRNGAEINERDPDGGTALMGSVSLMNRETAEMLISLGADVNARDDEGWTALKDAVFSGNQELAEILKRHGAKE